MLAGRPKLRGGLFLLESREDEKINVSHIRGSLRHSSKQARNKKGNKARVFARKTLLLVVLVAASRRERASERREEKRKEAALAA